MPTVVAVVAVVTVVVVVAAVVGRIMGFVDRRLVQHPLGSHGQHPPDVLTR